MLAVTDQGRGVKALPAPVQQENSDDMRQPINITVSPVIHMPEIKMPDTLRFSDMPAPIVNVAAPVVNVEKQDAPVVNVAAPIVNVAASEQPAPVVNVSAPRATSQTQTVNRDDKGNIVSTTTRITYEGQ